jgi:hypothetical protein
MAGDDGEHSYDDLVVVGGEMAGGVFCLHYLGSAG